MESQQDNKQTRGIAEFVANLKYEMIPENVRQRVKLLMLDSLGCAIYGANLEWTEILQRCLATLDGGTQVQGVGLDDVHRQGVLHVGSVVRAAVIAVGGAGKGMSAGSTTD